LQLKAAKMKVNTHEYVSLLFFIMTITFIISMLILNFFLTIIFPDPAYIYTLGIIISFGAASGVFFLGYYYPTTVAQGIKGKIERGLPFAVANMATTASSGVNPALVFKMLSVKEGEVANEAKRIYSDTSNFGLSIADAMTKAANRTPSHQFAELLWGMLSVMTTGGDLGEYLTERTKGFMAQYRRTLDEYSKQIYFYTEIYITLIIVGTLFFIVLSSIMSPLTGGDSLFLQTFLVFFFTPLVSAGFIILLKGLSPTG
jgi:flagellar protein FlaJ